jgi:hypothetical protein
VRNTHEKLWFMFSKIADSTFTRIQESGVRSQESECLINW